MIWLVFLAVVSSVMWAYEYRQKLRYRFVFEQLLLEHMDLIIKKGLKEKQNVD